MELENDAVLTARHFDTFNLFRNYYFILHLRRKLLKHVLGENFLYLKQLWKFQNRTEFKLKIITLPFYQNYKV